LDCNQSPQYKNIVDDCGVKMSLFNTIFQIGWKLLLAYYAYKVIRIYYLIKQRQKKIASYEHVHYKVEKGKLINEEEFEECLNELERIIPNHEVGFLSGASPTVRKVMRETANFAGGGVAALLQTAHPFIAKGISEHSNLKNNITLRFQNTFLYVFDIVFGDLPTILKAARAVKTLHNKVKGKFEVDSGQYLAGEEYTAFDVEAVKWVFSTLLETPLFMYDLLIEKLTDEEKQEIYSYVIKGSIAYGLTPKVFPETFKEFEDYYFSVINSDVMFVTKEAAIIKKLIMQPILWERYIPVVNTMDIVTGALMPPVVARKFGFKTGFWVELYASMFLALFSLIFQRIPPSMRYLTGYLKAEARENNREISAISKFSAKAAKRFVKLSLTSTSQNFSL